MAILWKSLGLDRWVLEGATRRPLLQLLQARHVHCVISIFELGYDVVGRQCGRYCSFVHLPWMVSWRIGAAEKFTRERFS